MCGCRVRSEDEPFAQGPGDSGGNGGGGGGGGGGGFDGGGGFGGGAAPIAIAA